MFLRILFKKLGLKEDKWAMAIFYGLGYMAFFLLLITVLELYLRRFNLIRNLLISGMVGLILSGMYLIKWKLFYGKIKI